MNSMKFGRLTLGLVSTCPKANVKNVVRQQSLSVRAAFVWTSSRKPGALTPSQKRTAQAADVAGHSASSRPHHVVGVLSSSLSSRTTTAADPGELKRFRSLAGKWWDERGEFAALHAMNDLRVPFIRDNLLSAAHGGRPGGQPGRPGGRPALTGLRVLDVGCGGGLLTEPLARLGARVLGIDPVEEGIAVARLRASRDPELRQRVRYRACTLEELTGREGEGEGEGEVEGEFDAVVASEVVEHLVDLETFVRGCDRALRPGGSLFVTTVNRTALSYALAVVAAERLLRVVPAGTHDWEKFVGPAELERMLQRGSGGGRFRVRSVRGMLYNPLTGRWGWSRCTAVNYALHAVKMG